MKDRAKVVSPAFPVFPKVDSFFSIPFFVETVLFADGFPAQLNFAIGEGSLVRLLSFSPSVSVSLSVSLSGIALCLHSASALLAFRLQQACNLIVNPVLRLIRVILDSDFAVQCFIIRFPPRCSFLLRVHHCHGSRLCLSGKS
jgi:hypothetical protein